MRGTLITLLATAVAAVALVTSIQAQKGPKPHAQPATLAFRCAFSTDPADPCPQGSLVPDGIRGDNSGLFNIMIDDRGEASLNLFTGGGRFIWLDFRNGPIRQPGDRRHFDTLMLDNVVFHNNVVDDAGNEVDGGLRSIPVGGSSRSRLKIAFSTLSPSGTTIAWAVRFNPEGFPGSDHITVRRLSTTTWELEATAVDRAILHSGLPRSKTEPPLSEGPFSMPFKALVVAQ